MFYFFNVTARGLIDIVGFSGTYENAYMSLWAALPAVVLFFAGIRLLMTMQKRG